VRFKGLEAILAVQHLIFRRIGVWSMLCCLSAGCPLPPRMAKFLKRLPFQDNYR
jgi:hypothetical protein